jgi:hypothetical protein
MSLSLRISSNEAYEEWVLSDRNIEDLDRYCKGKAQQALQVLLGADTQPFGSPWTASSGEVAAALESLLSCRIGRVGFEIRATTIPGSSEKSGRFLAGLKIDGAFHGVRCIDDYWQVWRTEQIGAGGLIETPKQYKPADIPTENFGIVRVVKRRGAGNKLKEVLAEMLLFVQSQDEKELTLTLG